MTHVCRVSQEPPASLLLTRCMLELLSDVKTAKRFPSLSLVVFKSVAFDIPLWSVTLELKSAAVPTIFAVPASYPVLLVKTRVVTDCSAKTPVTVKSPLLMVAVEQSLLNVVQV